MRVAGLFTLLGAFACGSSERSDPPENVGQACVPSAERNPEFSGFDLDAVSVESGPCGDAVCLVNHFRGRVTCTYGQLEGENTCTVPGSGEPVTVPVSSQLEERRPSTTVYCSCRCAGPDVGASYCECPDGFECAALIPNLGVGPRGLAGSYCIGAGTQFDPTAFFQSCDKRAATCP